MLFNTSSTTKFRVLLLLLLWNSEFKKDFYQQLATVKTKVNDKNDRSTSPDICFDKSSVKSQYFLISERLGSILPTLYADHIKSDNIPDKLIINIFRLAAIYLSFEVNENFLNCFSYQSMMKAYIQNTSTRIVIIIIMYSYPW